MTQNENQHRRATRTRQLWEPRAGRALSNEDLREIEANVTGFFGVLRSWAIREAQDLENGAVSGGADKGDYTHAGAVTNTSTNKSAGAGPETVPIPRCSDERR